MAVKPLTREPVMFRNYVATAVGNLARNKLYAAITILGLAVAFTVAILVGQFVRNEFSYNHWIPGHERIYKVRSLVQPAGQAPLVIEATAGLAGRVRATFPGAAIARLSLNGTTVKRGLADTPTAENKLFWADPDIFKVLPLPALAGDPATALQQPDTLVLTRQMARKYFGRDLPMGGVLLVTGVDGKYHPMRVAAVLKDLPVDSTLTTEIYASGRSSYSYLTFFDAHPNLGSFNIGLSTFARLAPGVSVVDFQRALDRAGQPDIRAFARGGGDKVSFQPAPLDEVHWAPDANGTPSGDKGVTYAILAVAGLIVMVAGINFVTLMTARASRRGVEVGVRKATGATRGQLMAQFMGEALVQVMLASLIAAALAEALVKPFNALVQRSLAVDFAHDPLLSLGLLGFALVIGLLAAVYPALVLSSFRPAAVLKGGVIRASGSPAARASLVAVQFAVLIGLIATTTTIYRQTRFALSQGMGAADSERILDVFSCDAPFVAEVRKLPGVSSAACSTMHGLNLVKLAQRVQYGGGQTDFDVAPIDVGLLEIYGVRPLAGRLFSAEHSEDRVLADPKAAVQPTVVLNETAARKLGFPDPRMAVGKTMTWTRDLEPGATPLTGPSQIIGVVPDQTVTVRSVVPPTFYFVMPKNLNLLAIKLTGRDVPGTVAAVRALWKRTGGAERPVDQMFWSQYRADLYRDLTVQGETIAICAGLAVLISCLGLFALAAFMTERRTKEIGIRKAMGAGTRDVVLLLVWQFTIPVLYAVAVATPVGFWAMGGWLQQFAYRVPLSAWTFLLAGAAAILIAWLTVSYQSYTVARAKPAGALQYE
jgi:putative ABC transport system permease protein